MNFKFKLPSSFSPVRPIIAALALLLTPSDAKTTSDLIHLGARFSSSPSKLLLRAVTEKEVESNSQSSTTWPRWSVTAPESSAPAIKHFCKAERWTTCGT